MPEMRFDDRVAVVTGAGRGLGRSFAEILAERGARVVVNDVLGAEDAAAALRAAGAEAIAVGEDISTPAGAAALIAATIAAFGRIDVLVNNAAISRSGPLADMTTEQWEEVRRVNLDGAFHVTRAAWPSMTERAYGRIVFLTSGAGLLGFPEQANYSATKGGVYGLTRTLALEGAQAGIMVNALAPVALTPMARGLMTPELIEYMREALPTSLVAPAVAVLAHADCPVSGALIDVAGGRVATLFVGATVGYYDRDLTPEKIRDHWSEVVDRTDYVVPDDAMATPMLIELAAQRRT